MKVNRNKPRSKIAYFSNGEEASTFKFGLNLKLRTMYPGYIYKI